MSLRVEYGSETAQEINASFVRKIEAGHIKEAAADGTAFVREILRQAEYAREILPPKMLTEADLDRDESSDQPKKIVEREPDSVATFVPFSGTGPRTWFKGPRFAVKFGKVESQRFQKNKWELMTYQNDIRKILSDNAVKDCADQVDNKFLGLCDDIFALNSDQVTSASAFNASAFKRAFQKIVGRRRPIGKILMGKSLLYEALELPATSIHDEAGKQYVDGIESKEKLWGIPVVSTIKTDSTRGDALSATKAYVFSPEDFLGKYFLLQDATLYIKQEGPDLMFYVYLAPGIGIANTLSMQRIDF